MNRRQMLSASVTAVGGALVSLRTDASKFGALGDGKTDDAPAIQAALDYVGANGGGVVFLPTPDVHYRIATGLVLPSYVTLEGPTPVHYPFNRGNKGVCALVADFDNTRQWVVEAGTRVGRARVPFDEMISGSLPDGVTYNCGIRNLLITSIGRVPYGGVRMHGCPGSFVEGVAIDGVGCGLLVNYSFGGNYKVHVDALYYGVAAWEDTNANIFEAYCSHRSPWPTRVPDDYRLGFMRDDPRGLVDIHKLSNVDHLSRPFGILCGASKSTSTNNVFDVVVEQFPGGIFMLNAYATDFRRCYLEGEANRMAYAIVASRSRFGIQAFHAYLSNTGALFDLGLLILAKIFASGILYAASFGRMPMDDPSLLIFIGVEPGTLGAPVRSNLRYLGHSAAKMPLVLVSPWRVAGGDYEVPSVRLDPWAHRVELSGTMVGTRAGHCFTLPANHRPARRRRFVVAGGTIQIGPDGEVDVKPSDSMVSLDGVTFELW